MKQCTNCQAISVDVDFIKMERVDKENLLTPLQPTDTIECFMCGADASYAKFARKPTALAVG